MEKMLLSVEETVTHADTYSERFYPFTVPEGATALRLAFEVDPQRVGPHGQAIGALLHGPAGFRGTPGRVEMPARIGPDGASPGLIPGPLEPGTWRIEVSRNYVLEGPPCTYRLRVWLEDQPDAAPLPPPRALPTAIPGTGPGWYRGDLHMHTHHSDGWWSVADLWRAVRERGLDFFMLTDHNTLSGQAEVAALATGNVLPIPGIEVTMRHGHLLALGVETPIDWRVGRDGRAIREVLRDVHAAGGVAIIAHPGADGSPICHGCRWELLDVDPRHVDALEVWNSKWQTDEDNERSLQFYDDWLARGFRVPISGGSDEHGERPSFGPGVPTTHVYARELSRDAILAGIRAGHVVVSSGPVLRVSGQVGAVTGLPGDMLPAAGPFSLEATVSGVAVPAHLTLLGNGTILAEATIAGQGACRYAAGRAALGWYRADLRTLDGREMLAIASPLFVG